MSEKSSNKTHRHLGRVARSADHTPVRKQKRQYRWWAVLIVPIWVLAAFYASQFIVIGVLYVLNWFHISLTGSVSSAVFQATVSAIIYALTIAIAIGLPYAGKRYKRHKTTLEQLGLTRLPTWGDIGLSPLAYIVYALLIAVVMTGVSQIPGFPTDQTQDVGFKAFGTRLDNLLAFATLVVVAPIAEETLFRGYLYGKLKGYVPTVVAAIVTSVLFGFVHMQWNVGVDVFVLSLILCGLRSLTGSIWVGVLVHMIKNGIAYYVLFVSPMIGG